MSNDTQERRCLPSVDLHMDNQNQQQQGGQQDQGGQQGGQNKPGQGGQQQGGQNKPGQQRVSNADFKIKGPANTEPFLCVEDQLSRLGGFPFHIDDAFRDLS